MIERVKTSWRLFAASRPGLRFRERYRLRQSRGHRGLHPVRLANLLGGAALIAVSAVLGWLPILGWGTAVLGLSMIAGESYPAARLMDRLEVGARRLLGPAGEDPGGAASLDAPLRLARDRAGDLRARVRDLLARFGLGGWHRADA